MQETNSGASNKTTSRGLGDGKGTSAFPGAVEGYTETFFSSETDRFFYNESKEKSFVGFGAFSTVERYVHISFMPDQF